MTALSASYVRSLRTVEGEMETSLALIEGALPAALRGVLYRNGPGRMERGGAPYRHLFDGDGMICRFHFGADGVSYRNRFVRTRGFVEEERAGRILHRGFGTNIPGSRLKNVLNLRFKNTANTNVMLHGGLLLALWEAGVPYALDPETLETAGPFDFGGMLQNRASRLERWLSPELPFSAHPRVDRFSGEVVNFGVAAGRTPRLMLYRAELDGRMDAPRALTLDATTFIHDAALTKSWRVFLLAPTRFELGAVLLGNKAAADCIRERPGERMRILLVHRERDEARWFEAEPGFVFHLANAYEHDDRVVVDASWMARYPDLSVLSDGVEPPPDGTGALLTRFELDLVSGAVTSRRLGAHHLEFPRTNETTQTRRHRYVYGIGAPLGFRDAFFPCVVKVDTETGASIARDFSPDLPGEAIFVPRPGATGEDDGWVCTVVYRDSEGRSELVVLDGEQLGVVCRYALPHSVPPGFHGTFVADPVKPALA